MARPNNSFTARVESPDMQRMRVTMSGAHKFVSNALRRRITAAAKPLVDAVKQDASFSTRIPDAVSSAASFSGNTATVTVTVDSTQAPNAAPLNNRGKPGEFQHPVFGQSVTVSQAAHPFFASGARRATPTVNNEMAKILSDVARDAGFK